MTKLSPEKIVEILKEHGTFVSVQEAEIILEFMLQLASISIDQILGK